MILGTSRYFPALCATFAAVSGWICFAADNPPPRVCATCHPKEAARYRQTGMGQSLIAPASLPAGRITHPTSDSVITTEQRNSQMFHSLSERGLTAEYPVRYQIGGALMGRTYMVQIGSYLFESPVSWFNRHGWDLSPGYTHNPVIDFDRSMEEQCLFCHTGSAQFIDPDRRRLKDTNLTAITCDRCHGSGEAHVRHPSSGNIMNPAKLTSAARDSVCEQCHLEGVDRVLNPGKNWSDFRVGEPTEQTFGTYFLVGHNGSEVVAVSHVEQLAQSKCAYGSGGKLWCGSCHNPHSQASDRPREIRAVCLSCHVALSTKAHPTAQSAVPQECTSCHMPRNAVTDIPHAAITDHRLLRHPSAAATSESNEAPKIMIWREGPPAVHDRNFGLAKTVIGFSRNLPDISADGIRTLKSLPAGQQNDDPIVLTALEGFALQSGDTAEAVRIGRHVVELQGQSAKAAMNFGIVLKRSGDLTEAERQFQRAIDLNPSLKQAYIELAQLYASQQQMKEVNDTIDRFLKWNSQDIMFRLQRSRLGTQP